MSRNNQRKLTQFVDSLVGQAIAVLAEAGIAEPKARDIGTEIARRLCSEMGRTQLYIPSDIPWAVTARDERLWEEYGQPGPHGVRPYTSARVDQLAVKFGITAGYVYTIARLIRDREVASRQGRLPGLDAAPEGEIGEPAPTCTG